MIKKCFHCGIEYKTPDKRRKYCSQKCYFKSGAGGFPKGINWKDENNPRWKGGKSCGYVLKLAIQTVLDSGRRLDICEICTSNSYVDIHHLNRNRQDNRSENLKVLCRSCHQKHHPEKIRNKNRCDKCGQLISLLYNHYCKKSQGD